MKKLILFCGSLFLSVIGIAQCTTTNATGCSCADGSSDCDLLPDITISWLGLQQGYTEYSQTSTSTTYSQGVNAGRLRVTCSTPNIGYGSFTVRGVDANGYRTFVCGNDTVQLYDPSSSLSFTCPDGNPNPKQLLHQRIYHKNGNTMTNWDR